MNKKILFTLLILTLTLSSCTSIKNQTLQISGAETITEWQMTDLECQSTQDCIDASLANGAALEEIEEKIRCRENLCEVEVERNIEIKKLE